MPGCVAGLAWAVGYPQQYRAAILVYSDCDRGSRGVLAGIGQRFLDDPVRAEADASRHLVERAGYGQLNRYAGSPGGVDEHRQIL